MPRKQFRLATVQGHALALVRKPTRGLAAWHCTQCGLSSAALLRSLCAPLSKLRFSPTTPSVVSMGAGGGLVASGGEVLLSETVAGSHPSGLRAHTGHPGPHLLQGHTGFTIPQMRRSLGRGPGRPRVQQKRPGSTIGFFFAQQSKRLCLRLAMDFADVGEGRRAPVPSPPCPAGGDPAPRFLPLG